MAVLRDAQETVSRDRHRYLNSSNKVKSVVIVVDLGKRLEKAEEEGDPVGRRAVSTNLDPDGSLGN